MSCVLFSHWENHQITEEESHGPYNKKKNNKHLRRWAIPYLHAAPILFFNQTNLKVRKTAVQCVAATGRESLQSELDKQRDDIKKISHTPSVDFSYAIIEWIHISSFHIGLLFDRGVSRAINYSQTSDLSAAIRSWNQFTLLSKNNCNCQHLHFPL